MNLAALSLAASTFSPARSAPIQYKYGNLLVVDVKGRAVLISRIPLETLGAIPIPPLLTSFVASNSLVLPLTVPAATVTPIPFSLSLALPVIPLKLPNTVSQTGHSLHLLQAHLLWPQSHPLQPQLHPLHPQPHPPCSPSRTPCSPNRTSCSPNRTSCSPSRTS